MEYINKVELQGVIGKINESVISNYKVYTFNILVNYTHQQNDGGFLIESTWVTVKCHDKMIEGTLECGKFAHIIGRLRKETYVDSSNKQCSMYFVLANSIKVFHASELSKDLVDRIKDVVYLPIKSFEFEEWF